MQKVWSQDLYEKLIEVYKVANKWANPLTNDAGGSHDCANIANDVKEYIDMFERLYSIEKVKYDR